MLPGPQGLEATSLSPAVSASITAEIQAAVVGLFDFKGSTDASTNPNYPAASKGDAYMVSVAGKIGGASGLTVEVGDLYFALADNAGGTQAAVGSSWDVLQYNITGITAAGLAMMQAASASAQLALLAPVPLTSLASQADQTLVGNVSGGAASPIALTATQVETMLQGTARTQQDFASAIGGTATARLGWLAAGVLAMALTASDSPSAQTLEIGDRSLIGSGSNNIGGGDATLRSGLGKGTGTPSSIIFQTPTLAASGTGTQAFATRLTIATAAITAIPPITVNLASGTNGFMVSTSCCLDAFGVLMRSGGLLGWSSGSTFVASGSSDLYVSRLGPANLLQGKPPSASPIAQIFTLGEASRPGTDTDIAGASGTIRSGLGTGAAAASSLIFQTPTLVASGSTVQTYATRLTIATAALTATVPVLHSDGSAALPSISLASDPNTGLYSVGADQLGFSTGGTVRCSLDTNGFSFNSVNAYAQNGSVSFPSISFTNDSDCGMYRVGTNDIALVRGGAIAMRMNTDNTSFATAAKGTTDTTGWLMIPSCAGTPTGVPANIPTGQIAIVYDTTADKLWFYRAGWKRAQVTAVDAVYA